MNPTRRTVEEAEVIIMTKVFCCSNTLPGAWHCVVTALAHLIPTTTRGRHAFLPWHRSEPKLRRSRNSPQAVEERLANTRGGSSRGGRKQATGQRDETETLAPLKEVPPGSDQGAFLRAKGFLKP